MSAETLTLQEVPYSDANMLAFLSHVANEHAILNSEEVRQLCDAIIQAYIDSHEQPLMDDQCRSVEEAIDYLTSPVSPLDADERDSQNSQNIIRVISLGSKALATNNADVPDSQFEWSVWGALTGRERRALLHRGGAAVWVFELES